jgi:Uma2 family endonuclease
MYQGMLIDANRSFSSSRHVRMTAIMATIDTLLTKEEFLALPDNGQRTELVRGRIVMMNVPAPRHGQVCAATTYLLNQFVRTKNCGHVVSNDSGVITERNPDTVRGADVSYYSYDRYPQGPLPGGYLDLPPEAVFEVLSPSDRWAEVLEKVAEYLAAGVLVVCVLDPEEAEVHVYRPDKPPRTFAAGSELPLPEVHAEFRVNMAEFFD